jgi:NitT/TauT family transport system substrate-binding protein
MLERIAILTLGVLLGSACTGAGARPEPNPSAPAPGAAGAPAAAPAAPTPEPERLRIIYSSLSGNYMPLWIAVNAGLFREQGLDAELLLIESGTAATQALVAGEAPLANVAAAAVINAMVEGFDAAFVQATVQVPPLTLFTRPDLRAPEELRGARLGVTRFGSSTDVVGRMLLRRWGLEPERDVALLQLGSVPELLAALQSGAVDAAVLSDPTSLRAAKLGFRVAADAAELQIPYLHLGTVVPRSVLAARPDLIRRYLLAYQAGLERFFADPALAQRTLAEYMRLDDPEILEGTYRLYAEKYFQRDVRPRPEALAPILATVTNPRAREVAPETLIDDRLVRDLQRAGLLPAAP